MSICYFCDETEATDKHEGEPICADCLKDWWHDNSFTCKACEKPHVKFDDGYLADDGEWFCNASCESEHEQERYDYVRHNRFESLASRFI